MNTLSDIGLIGLAVMGENLVLNMESKGFTVAVLTVLWKKSMISFYRDAAKGKKLIGRSSIWKSL